MSTLLRKIISVRRFIMSMVLFFTIKIHLVHTVLSLETNDINAVLLEKNILREKLKSGHAGKEFTVLAVNFPPFFSYKKLKNGNFTFGGFNKPSVDMFAEWLNASVKYVILDPADVVKYGLNAAINPYLDNKVVDFVPIPRPQNVDTMKHMELVTPFWIESSILLQPYPKEESRLDVIKRPFELPVWLCVLLTTTVFILVSAIIIKNKANITNDPNSSRQSLRQIIYNQLDFVFRLFTNQGTSGTHARTRTSFKILTAIWLLSVVVLINAYSGVLTSLLAVTKLKPIAQTMKDVAESKELRLTVEKSSIYFRLFMNATKGYEKNLGDQLRKEPALVVPDAVSIPNNVIQYNAAYPGSAALVKYMISEDTKRNGHCRTTYSNELIAYPTVVWQFQLPIGSPYAKVYSEELVRYWDSGIIAYSREEYSSKSKDECRVDKPTETKKTALTLIHLSPAFLILGVGFLLSILCFIFEMLSKYVLIWSTRRVYNMDTEQSLQPSCESRPGTGNVEISGTTDPTEYTSQCQTLGEDTEDVAQWIRVPVVGTDEMQGEGVRRNTGLVEFFSIASATSISSQCEALEEKTGDEVAQWIVLPVVGADGMQAGEGVNRDSIPMNSEMLHLKYEWHSKHFRDPRQKSIRSLLLKKKKKITFEK